MPDLRQLRIFIAVAEELGFTRAGERLHLGQQAVSKAIATLEAELGVELFERTTHDVRPTAAGLALLQAGPAVLATADAAFERARAAGNGLSGTVRVGITPAIGPGEREEVALTLRDDTVELSVSLVELRPDDIRPLLIGHKLDLVLARTCGALDGIEVTPLRPTPAILCVPESDPLAGRRTVRLVELDGARLMTWNSSGTPYTDLLVNRLAAAGAAVEPVRAHVSGAVLGAELAEAGAVTLMPADWPPTEGIVQVRLAEDVTLPLLLIWNAGLASPVVARLRAAMASSD